MSNIVALSPERVQIYQGRIRGDDGVLGPVRWFAEWCIGEGDGTLLKDYPTEAEAILDSYDMELPIWIDRVKVFQT